MSTSKRTEPWRSCLAREIVRQAIQVREAGSFMSQQYGFANTKMEGVDRINIWGVTNKGFCCSVDVFGPFRPFGEAFSSKFTYNKYRTGEYRVDKSGNIDIRFSKRVPVIHLVLNGVEWGTAELCDTTLLPQGYTMMDDAEWIPEETDDPEVRLSTHHINWLPGACLMFYDHDELDSLPGSVLCVSIVNALRNGTLAPTREFQEYNRMYFGGTIVIDKAHRRNEFAVKKNGDRYEIICGSLTGKNFVMPV